MPRAVPVPTALENINKENVNSNKEYRREFLGVIEKMSEIIYDLREKMKDSEYKELYEKLSELYDFKEKLGLTIIFQAIKHKENLNTPEVCRPRTEEDKIKKGFVRCNICDALLQNVFSLSQHKKRNICKKVHLIKETTRIVSKTNGEKFTTSKLIYYKNAFELFSTHIVFRREFNDLVKDYNGRLDDFEDYIGNLDDKENKKYYYAYLSYRHYNIDSKEDIERRNALWLTGC